MLCQDLPVHIIGAGNSAGQAAMYLSGFSSKVTLVVRSGDLRKSMSSYLSERVELNPRINIQLHTELRAVEGTVRLEKCPWKIRRPDKPVLKIAAAFLFSSVPPPAPVFWATPS